ncbi:hypothetical protein HKBW3S09_01989, partial [Candidatus Hakubella thermalkaliphila]
IFGHIAQRGGDLSQHDSHIPYQSLLKMFVADKIEEELRSAR